MNLKVSLSEKLVKIENKNIKENLKILGLVYLLGVSVGIIIEIIGMMM